MLVWLSLLVLSFEFLHAFLEIFELASAGCELFLDFGQLLSCLVVTGALLVELLLELGALVS